MSNSDIKLIIWLLLISIFIYSLMNLLSASNTNMAIVYYDKEVIKKIDLNIDKTYLVKGYNGTVVLKVNNKRIKVDEEKSPLHICSYQGYISKSNQVLVCLPNKIIVKIVNNKNELDSVAK